MFFKTGFEKQQYLQSGFHLPLDCAFQLYALTPSWVFHGRLPYPYLCKQNVFLTVPLVKIVILEQDSNIWGQKGSLTGVTEQIKTQLNTKHENFINLEKKQQKRDLHFLLLSLMLSSHTSTIYFPA